VSRLGLTASNPHRTAHLYVLETLRSAILRGDLRGGVRLVQADIARELGVSTTPVREALRDLSAEGLVRLDAHRGAVVHQLSMEELEDIQRLISILEPEAMRDAARVADPERLTEALALLDELEVETDPLAWEDLNREFHASLTGLIPSVRLQGILASLRDSAAPYLALALRDHGTFHFERANSHHRALAEALLAHDAERAAVLAREHIALTVAAIRSSAPLDERDGSSDTPG
jgi:DNA-binding GntR family transcriptional regulator